MTPPMQPPAPKKLPLFYFVAFSVVVVLIFAVSISSYYVDFYGKLSTIKRVLKSEVSTPRPTSPTIDPRDPVAGPSSAPVTLIEYADITCPACAQADAAVDEIHALYGDRVRIVFKGITITGHPERKRALIASYCAKEQGKFWEYKSLLYQNQLTLGMPLYASAAGELGLNTAAFSTCIDGTAYDGYIADAVADALQIGLASTPTIYLNGRAIPGPYTTASLKSSIDAVLN